MNPQKHIFFLFLCSLFFVGAAQADDVLWQSGANLYIKLVSQDKFKRSDTPPNQQPINLNAEKITQALGSIRIYSGGGFLKESTLQDLFSIQQSCLLGQYISLGLDRARPDQDIVFVLARSEKKYLVIRNTKFTAGRVFYSQDKLNIIIGDYDSTGDLFKQRVEQSAGVSNVKQYFKSGRRAKASSFKGSVITSAGVSMYEDGGEQRNDWLEVDINAAAAAYLAQGTDQDAGQGADDKAAKNDATQALTQTDAAELARQNREMRLEMARIRKQLEAAAQSPSSSTASVEERLLALKALLDKALISPEEYEQKRQEILNDM